MALAEPPRPRQARSIATRRALLDAAIACLVDVGYASITTAAVCDRAGMSQGALFKHFPTKAALLVATVEHLFAELIVDFRNALEAAGEGDDDDDPIGRAVRHLDRTFREPRLLAAYDLYTAARTDRELAAALKPVVADHHEALRREARALFPRAAESNPDFEAFVDLVLSAMQGRALGSLAGAPGDVHELVTLYRLARRELEPAKRRRS